jgi:hypothetical protein
MMMAQATVCLDAQEVDVQQLYSSAPVMLCSYIIKSGLYILLLAFQSFK